MEAPILQIRGEHVEVSDDAEAIAAACRVFRDGGFVRFPALVDDATLRAWNGDEGGRLRRVLAELLSEPRVLDVVGRIVGDEAGEFRADRAPLLGEGWHEGPSRRCLAALAVHVGREACRGSALETRLTGRAPEVVSIPTTTPGDAVLFRFDDGLEYRMCAGTDVPESTFTGRFVRPDEPASVPVPPRR